MLAVVTSGDACAASALQALHLQDAVLSFDAMLVKYLQHQQQSALLKIDGWQEMLCPWCSQQQGICKDNATARQPAGKHLADRPDNSILSKNTKCTQLQMHSF